MVFKARGCFTLKIGNTSIETKKNSFKLTDPNGETLSYKETEKWFANPLKS